MLGKAGGKAEDANGHSSCAMVCQTNIVPNILDRNEPKLQIMSWSPRQPYK